MVIFVQANGDKTSSKAATFLTELQTSLADQEVEFLMLNTSDNRDSIIAEAEQQGINFPILIDEAPRINVPKCINVPVLTHKRAYPNKALLLIPVYSMVFTGYKFSENDQ